jgi:hypothetical protein
VLTAGAGDVTSYGPLIVDALTAGGPGDGIGAGPQAGSQPAGSRPAGSQPAGMPDNGAAGG